MSVLMTVGKKVRAAQLAAQKIKEKKKKSEAEAHRRADAASFGPPTSDGRTVVWYWQLNGVPTTVMYHKDTNQVWCNGYILETVETFGSGLEAGGAITFGIYVEQLDSVYQGKICRLLVNGADPSGFAYELYVDDCHVPQHTGPGMAGALDIRPQSQFTGAPPRYEQAVYGEDSFLWSNQFGQFEAKKGK